MTFTVLTVCTGNICRSALAEYLLRRQLEATDAFVESAGLHAVEGGLVPRLQIAVAAEFGVDDISEHTGRQITTEMIERADLVLTATRKQRRDVVRMMPSAVGRTFTMREFAHLAREATPQNLDIAELIAEVGARRGQSANLQRPEDYDIQDPFRQSVAVYQESAQQVADAMTAVASYLNTGSVAPHHDSPWFPEVSHA